MLDVVEVQQLRDEALIERLMKSVRNERRGTVATLIAMGEVIAREAYRELGFSSMFEFAMRRLGMSEAEAALRIRAAKVGRAFPEGLEMLALGEVNLSTLSLLSPILTKDNLVLLYEARFMSKRQVLELIAKHSPRPDTADLVRRVPGARPSARAQRARMPLSVASSPPPSAASKVEPLSPERHRISFTGSQRVRDLLEEAQDLRRHRYPDGELESIFEDALELLVAEEKKRRFAVTPAPRARTVKGSGKHSRYIPHAVRRHAWARCEGRCCFVSADGTRCRARSRLEFHHVAPFGRGGGSTTENIVLVCRSHNALHADRDFGRAFMQHRILQRTQNWSGSESSLIRHRG